MAVATGLLTLASVVGAGGGLVPSTGATGVAGASVAPSPATVKTFTWSGAD